jgi:hypothetical protein
MFGDFEDLEAAGSSASATKSYNHTSRRGSAADDGDKGADFDEDGGGDSDVDMDEGEGAESGDDADDDDGLQHNEASSTTPEAIAAARAAAAAAKAAKKVSFDAEYDRQRAGAGDDDDAGPATAAGKQEGDGAVGMEALEDPEAAARAARARVQAEINASEFASLPPSLRHKLTGLVAGTYVRLEIGGMSAEFSRLFRCVHSFLTCRTATQASLFQA